MKPTNEPIQIKLVVVGDGSIGKTCMLLSYTTDKFPSDYVPTVFENYNSYIQVDDKMVNLSLWDTAGQETYSNLRTLSYGEADIFLIVYSVIDQTSFENAMHKWLPELQQQALAQVPKIIVGNKIDLRSIDNDKHIQKEQVSSLQGQKNLNCKFMECSAFSQIGLKEVFEEATRTVLYKRSQSLYKQLGSTNKKVIKEETLTRDNDNCCLVM